LGILWGNVRVNKAERKDFPKIEVICPKKGKNWKERKLCRFYPGPDLPPIGT